MVDELVQMTSGGRRPRVHCRVRVSPTAHGRFPPSRLMRARGEDCLTWLSTHPRVARRTLGQVSPSGPVWFLVPQFDLLSLLSCTCQSNRIGGLARQRVLGLPGRHLATCDCQETQDGAGDGGDQVPSSLIRRTPDVIPPPSQGPESSFLQFHRLCHKL